MRLDNIPEKYRILLFFVLVFLISRTAAIMAFSDRIFYGEELSQGVVAKEIMEGPDLPVFEYTPVSYSGGSLVEGIIAIPLFMLFGPTLFALKLTPVLFATATLIILFLFAYRFFNRRVAVIAAILYLSSSPMWLVFNIYFGAFHSENLVFTLLALYLFYAIIYDGKDKPIYYLLLGITCGFGTYFSYTFLVTQLVILLVWFIHNRKMFFKAQFYVFAAGFSLGLLPWFYYNWGCGFQSPKDIFPEFFDGNNYLDAGIWPAALLRFFRNLWFAQMLKFAFLFIGAAYNIIYWLSFIYIASKQGRPFKRFIYSRYFFLLVFPILLIFIYTLHTSEVATSAFFMAWRYLVALYIFVFLTVAIAADRLFERFASLKKIALVIFSVCVLCGIGYYAGRIDPHSFGKAMKQRGYTYYYLADAFTMKYPNNLYRVLDNITRLSAPERYEVLCLSLNNLQFCERPEPVDFAKYMGLARRLEEKYRPRFYKVLVEGLYYHSALSVEDLIRQLEILSGKLEDKYRPFLYEGVGALMVVRFPDRPQEYSKNAHFINEQGLPYYYRGLAEPQNLEEFNDYLTRFRKTTELVESRYRPLYLEAVGESLIKFGISYIIEKSATGNSDIILRHFFHNLNPAQREHILRGAARGLAYIYSRNNDREISELISNYFLQADKETVWRELKSNLKGQG